MIRGNVGCYFVVVYYMVGVGYRNGVVLLCLLFLCVGCFD